jgi:hypothetical protein
MSILMWVYTHKLQPIDQVKIVLDDDVFSRVL